MPQRHRKTVTNDHMKGIFRHNIRRRELAEWAKLCSSHAITPKIMQIASLTDLLPQMEIPVILKALVAAHRHLAELKGIAKTIPNQAILLSTLSLQEAQDSSAIENIITTQDALFKYRLQVDVVDVAAKEVSYPPSMTTD